MDHGGLDLRPRLAGSIDVVWRIKETKSEQPAADAKKAEGASCAALLIPNPPDRTGREAGKQPGLSASMLLLVMVFSKFLNWLS